MKKDKLINLAWVAAAAVVMMTAVSAHAISPHYRQQLERSGCTQQTDGNGCDIHKSRQQNQAAINSHQQAVKTQRKQVAAFLRDSVQGQSVIAAAEALHSYGFTETDPGVWLKNGESDVYVVDVITQGGHIKTAVLK